MVERFAGQTDRMFRFVVDGMNYTPSSPSFEEMRDGILQAVAVGGNAADCGHVWSAFAQFGVGARSSAVINADGTVTTAPSLATGSCDRSTSVGDGSTRVDRDCGELPFDFR